MHLFVVRRIGENALPFIIMVGIYYQEDRLRGHPMSPIVPGRRFGEWVAAMQRPWCSLKQLLVGILGMEGVDLRVAPSSIGMHLAILRTIRLNAIMGSD